MMEKTHVWWQRSSPIYGHWSDCIKNRFLGVNVWKWHVAFPSKIILRVFGRSFWNVCITLPRPGCGLCMYKVTILYSKKNRRSIDAHGHTSQLWVVLSQEAKYVESWPNTTSAWAGWSRFDIPVDRYNGVYSLLQCTEVSYLPLGKPAG